MHFLSDSSRWMNSPFSLLRYPMAKLGMYSAIWYASTTTGLFWISLCYFWFVTRHLSYGFLSKCISILVLYTKFLKPPKKAWKIAPLWGNENEGHKSSQKHSLKKTGFVARNLSMLFLESSYPSFALCNVLSRTMIIESLGNTKSLLCSQHEL